MGTRVCGGSGHRRKAPDFLRSKMLLDKALHLGPHQEDSPPASPQNSPKTDSPNPSTENGAVSKSDTEMANATALGYQLLANSLHPQLQAHFLSLAAANGVKVGSSEGASGSSVFPVPFSESGEEEGSGAGPGTPDSGLPHDGGSSRPRSAEKSGHSGLLSGMITANGSPEEASLDLEELEEFAKTFKRKRIKLGFTQGDVGAAIGQLEGSDGSDFSQTTISRFEALNLSFKNMCKLRPLLSAWLQQTETALANGSLPHQSGRGGWAGEAGFRRRKKRTSIESHRKAQLEAAFAANPRPQADEVAKIAAELVMEKEVIRVWFCNRRQKAKRLAGSGPSNSAPNTLNSPALNFLSSPLSALEEPALKTPRVESSSWQMEGSAAPMLLLLQQIAARKMEAEAMALAPNSGEQPNVGEQNDSSNIGEGNSASDGHGENS